MLILNARSTITNVGEGHHLNETQKVKVAKKYGECFGTLREQRSHSFSARFEAMLNISQRDSISEVSVDFTLRT